MWLVMGMNPWTGLVRLVLTDCTRDQAIARAEGYNRDQTRQWRYFACPEDELPLYGKE